MTTVVIPEDVIKAAYAAAQSRYEQSLVVPYPKVKFSQKIATLHIDQEQAIADNIRLYQRHRARSRL